MDITPDATDGMHRLLTSIVSPRPIAWVSTMASDGTDNVAPYSYYNVVSTRPPVVMVSARELADGTPKDTVRNVLDTGEFVVNLVTEGVAEDMVATSHRFPEGTSEFDAVGIERADSETVTPPRVADAGACLECTRYDHQVIYEHTVLYGEVEHIYVHPALTTDGKIDMRKIDAVGRLGGPFYTGVSPRDLTEDHLQVDGLARDMFDA